MNESDRVELERLKASHARLQADLQALAGNINALEQRLTRTEEIIPEIPPPTSAPPVEPALPPIIPEVEIPPPPEVEAASTTFGLSATETPQVRRATGGLPPEGFRACKCAQCDGEIEFPASEANSLVNCPHCGQLTRLIGVVAPATPPPIPQSVPEVATQAAEDPARPVAAETPPPVIPPFSPREREMPQPEGSFEMRLGTYWLVRIGVVMLLTALVFFANYAYQRFIMQLGAGGKVSLCYLASFALLGAGGWWQRKAAKESLKNFGQVLFAGGLAAVYFTTYAAHHIPTLLVIKDAVLDGALLLGWAGFIAWIADRKKSEVLALFAVGLAYYSSVITTVGSFTLYSNLVLTLAAVFFLVRNRWAGLTFASLVATYASYAYWRFVHPEGARFPTPDEGLWSSACFLIGYWLVFTSAVFLSKHEKFTRELRPTFLTFNNGAFFTLFLLTMVKLNTGKLWEFLLIYGAVLLVLAGFAKRFLAGEQLSRNAYLTQGLALVTAGFVSKYLDAPRTLALVLATESVILFVLGTQRESVILEFASYISAAMSVGWSIDGLERFDTRGVWLGSTLGAMMLFNAWWSHRKLPETQRGALRPVAGYFTVLALTIWFFTTWQNTEHEYIGLALALETLALTLAGYFLRVREIPLLGQSYLLLAQIAWAFDPNKGISQLTALALAANSVALLPRGWWRKELAFQAGSCIAAALAVLWCVQGLERDSTRGLLAGAALAAVGILNAWLTHQKSDEQSALRAGPGWFSALVIVTAIATTWFNANMANFPLALMFEALALTASIYFLRVRELALLGQTLVLAGHCMWQYNLSVNAAPPWWNPLLMIGMTLGLGHWWQKQKTLAANSPAPIVFQLTLSLLLVILACTWLGRECSGTTWLALSCGLAVAVTAYAAVTRAWLLAACAQLFLLPGGWLFLQQLERAGEPKLAALAPMAALVLFSLAAVQWFRRKTDANDKLRAPLLALAAAYRWFALAMSLWWVLQYIARPEQVWTFTLIGAVIFGLAGWLRSREAVLFGGVYTIAGLVLFWLRSFGEDFIYLPNLLAVLTWLAQQRVARRLPQRYALDEAAHTAVICVGCASLWRYGSLWVELSASGFYLTASWSALALALFVCGMALRERMYRWAGLAVLTGALGRVVLIDVWTLETIFRVLSFFALGLVLIVLGFIYNKYQEKIREWL